jgi:hypothetical protein
VGDMAPEGKAVNQENLNEADFMETKFASLPSGSRARYGGTRPKAPQGNKYTPLGCTRWLPIEINSSESRWRSPQGGR